MIILYYKSLFFNFS